MKGITSVQRDHTIDIVRGIAIITMVGANLAILLPEPHSPFIRWYSSFAAPIFVTLAGTMMALAVDENRNSKHRLSYFMKRGAFLVLVAAIIDIVAWRFVPFMAFDVLYLLGFSLPLLYLSAYLNQIIVFLLASGVFALTPVLQELFGYVEVPHMVDLVDVHSVNTLELAAVVKHWFVDGWFPFFPWLGYGLFGVFLGRYRWRRGQPPRSFSSLAIGVIALAGVVAGIALMAQNPGPQYARDGFSELFYPASAGFMTASLGIVLGCIALVDAFADRKFWSFFRYFGEASLFMYTVHSIIIGSAILTLWSEFSSLQYVAAYASLIAFLSCCGWWLRLFRRANPNMPLALKWFVGG